MGKPQQKTVQSEQPEKLSLTSADIAALKREQMKELFPEAFSENKIDFDQLKRVLGEWVDAGKERFGLNWPGKAECVKIIQQPSIATLKPSRDESLEFDTTENIFIEGDNLEVLKLLQKSYFGKIKVIYIDPPYNTGNDFIYPDNYAETLDTYLAYTGQVDDEGKRFSTNTEATGRYHSNWLNMMYPRLYLAKNLLLEEGVIFISIDDHEQANLKALCDIIFGEENFIADIIWQKKFARANDAAYFSTMHDHILCYAKNSKQIGNDNAWELNLLDRGEETPEGYSNPDNDSRGDWTSVVLSAKSGTEKLRYKIVTPSGRVCLPPDGRYWAVNEEKLKELVKDNRIWFGKGGDGIPRLKTFLSEVQSGLRPNTIWFHEDVGHNQEGRQELKALFDDKALFDSPKPVRLLKTILKIASDKSDFIVLDFFAGSSTTAHAVMAANSEDNGKRKFIMVQLPEIVDESSDVFKAGYATIADISKERIRRASKKISKEIKEQLDLKGNGIPDLGFKAFKLSQSNFKIWEGAVEKIEGLEKQLDLHVDHIASKSTQDDILYEILLKAGFPLTTKVEKTKMAGKQVYSIEEGALLICLEAEITEELIDTMANASPIQVICLDAGFKGNDQLKTNAVQTFKSRAQSKEQEIVFRTV